MANTLAPFKQIDVTRAVKGVEAAGYCVGGVEIDPHSGKISVIFGDVVDATNKPKGWDDACAKEKKG